MSDLSIKSEGLGKEYVVGGAEQQYDSYREMLAEALVSPFRKVKTLRGSVAQENRFWALKDVDFEIQQGDVVGVIGHNGAGKSTLLKILSRITAPTLGKVTIHGRVASLLEVGTGFHPELTGRENIYLNGSILGMRRSQIDRKFDEIVAFSDIEKFLDTPVKRYSSGMYVRLAFSVAAHLDTDVLLVDEILAVGDQRFQKKCLGMLSDVSSKGRTVLFVSHNLAAVSELCNTAIVLDKGSVAFNGDIDQALSAYEKMSSLERNDYALTEKKPISIKATGFTNTEKNSDNEFFPGVKCCIKIEFECFNQLRDAKLTLGIYNDLEQRLGWISTESMFEEFIFSEGSNVVYCEITSLPLVAGRYYINVAAVNHGELIDVVSRAITFTIRSKNQIFSERNINGPIFFDSSWKK